jgi:hypothetical protein
MVLGEFSLGLFFFFWKKNRITGGYLPMDVTYDFKGAIFVLFDHKNL